MAKFSSSISFPCFFTRDRRSPPYFFLSSRRGRIQACILWPTTQGDFFPPSSLPKSVESPLFLFPARFPQPASAVPPSSASSCCVSSPPSPSLIGGNSFLMNPKLTRRSSCHLQKRYMSRVAYPTRFLLDFSKKAFSPARSRRDKVYSPRLIF